MHTLYRSAGAGSMAPESMFEEAGVACEKIDVDLLAKSPEFLAVNPLGQVPTLVLEDGTLLTESGAMVLYLADRYPEAQLAPPIGDPARAPFCRWLFFLSANVYNGTLRYMYADTLSTDAGAAEGIKAMAARDLDGYFDVVEAALDPGPYLLGARYSGADAYLWMLAGWQDDRDALFARCPRLGTLCDRVGERPAIARVAAAN